MHNTSANSGEPMVKSKVGADPGTIIVKAMVTPSRNARNVKCRLSWTVFNMIVPSRAFQANGNIITTGDEIFQDLVKLKR